MYFDRSLISPFQIDEWENRAIFKNQTVLKASACLCCFYDVAVPLHKK